jgi:hypothetical protein
MKIEMHECDCLCHKIRGGAHIFPCCHGPCTHCGGNIKFGFEEEHEKHCSGISKEFLEMRKKGEV